MLGIRVPDPDEVMLISGKALKDGAPFRVKFGRAFVPPFLNHVEFFTLSQQQARITEDCFTKEKIPVSVVATISFKVPAVEEAVIAAGQRFLRDQTGNKMAEQVGQITAGAVRGIVGEMTFDSIISERTVLQEKVLDHAKNELSDKGLQVDNLNIADIQDRSPDESAIKALSAPHLAEIQRDAAIAQARAAQASVTAQQDSERQQADAEQQTAVAKAGYDAGVAEAQATRDQRVQVANAKAEAQIGTEKAKAEQAGPLAQAEASKDVARAQTALAEQEALLTENQLKSTVVKPAEAEAAKTKVSAEAEAAAIKLRAEAAASNNRVSLDQQLLPLLPDIVREAAGGLRGANLTVLNGTEGLSEVVTGLVGQAKLIYEVARTVRATDGAAGGSNGDRQTEPQQIVR